MKMRTPCLILLLSILSISVYADEPPQAISLSAAELSGDILEGQPIKQIFGNDAQFIDVYTSEDKKFNIGVFGMVVEEKENGRYRYESFPADEIMFFLEGRMKLIDDNGKVTEAGPGEALFIPKGWSGTRITNNIRKLSVRYVENP